MKPPSDVRRIKPVLLLYAGTSVLLWPLPVFGLLHAESAAVVAGVAFFAAGLSSLRLFRNGASFRRALGLQEGALLVPWALLTLSLLWRPNCGYLQGLLFFALFPVISVVLAVALAFALAAARWRRKRLLFGLIGGAVALLTPLYDLGFHPQFYVYNHVFGGVLGPIYDEELVLRPGLFWFRGLTLLWAAFAYFVGREWGRGRGEEGEEQRSRGAEGERGKFGEFGGQRGRGGEGKKGRGEFAPFPLHPQPPTPPHSLSPFLPFFIAIPIAMAYLFAARLGINTTAEQIARTLGGHRETEHFDIYYSPDALTSGEVDRLAADHEYRYAWLAARLGSDPASDAGQAVEGRIQSYIYPDAETKARLTGARYTNVAPVWLPAPQAHVLGPAYADVFGHELAHVFSRPFGLPVLRASLSVGLVEGLAVALEPPDGRPSPHEQVAVAWLGRIGLGAAREGDLASALAARLSPFGFWTSRGAVSYTTMGSFMRYLLEAYGPGPLKAVYAHGRFADVYGKPLADLAAEWERYLLGQDVTARSAEALVARRFTVPSLFEQRCPHHVPAYERRYRAGAEALAAGDTTQALGLFEASLARQPAYERALDAWAQVQLAQHDPEAVIARLDTLEAAYLGAALALRLGDAYALRGREAAARRLYDEALGKLPRYRRDERALVVIRKSLAEDPAAVRVLVSGLPAAVQAERLGGSEGSAVRVMRALRWAAAGDYEQAAAVLRATSVPALAATSAPASAATSAEEREDVRRQRLAWLAAFHYAANAPEAAVRYAHEAAEAALQAGDFNEIARLGDFACKVRWVEEARATSAPFQWRRSEPLRGCGV